MTGPGAQPTWASREGCDARRRRTRAPRIAPRGPRRSWCDSGADLDVAEALDGDAGLVGDGLHGLLVVGDAGLLQEDVLLEEAVDATLDDLGQGLLGLALLLGRGLGDLALLGDE